MTDTRAVQTHPRSPRPRVHRRTITLAVALVAVVACARSEGDAPASKPIEAKPEAEPEAEPLPPVEPELWAATCEEALLAGMSMPPPPPPPQLPARADALPATSKPAAPATAGPFPQRHARVPQPGRSPLPARLGLREGACDPQPLVRLHAHHSGEESLHCAIAYAFEVCGPLEQAMQWTERRAKDFPHSVDARLALAIRRFAPLQPDPTSGVAFNEALPAAERLAIAERVIADVDQILQQRPTDDLAHELAVLAHIQKGFARGIGWFDEPHTREDVLELLRVRSDAMAAWEHLRAIGHNHKRPSCGEEDPGQPCIPPAPLTPEQQRADAALEARLSAPGQAP